MSQQSSEAYQLYQKGRTLLDLNRSHDAEKKFAEAYLKDPKLSLALWGLGVSLLDQGKSAEGEKELIKGITLFPHQTVFYHSLALHYQGLERYAKALQICEEWLKQSPHSPNAHRIKAQILVRFKPSEKDTIRFHIKEAMSLSPADSDVYEVMGEVTWILDKNKEAALIYYEEAKRLNPADAMAHNNFGVFLIQSGDAHRALEEFRTAIRLNPTLDLSVNNFGIALASTHPFLAWSYKVSLFFQRFPVIGRLNGFAMYFVVRTLLIFAKRGTIPSFLAFIIIVPYVFFTLYTFFGNRIFMWAFKKGWIK